MSEAFPNSKVKIVDHPLALAVLTKLRDRRTKQIEFRKGLVKLGRLIGYWITMDFEKKEIEVEIFPNRPDMLSEQGFARAFSAFIGEKTGL